MTAPRYGLDDVRTACAEVAAQADHVQIDQARLASFAQKQILHRMFLEIFWSIKPILLRELQIILAT